MRMEELIHLSVLVLHIEVLSQKNWKTLPFEEGFVVDIIWINKTKEVKNV